MFYNVGSIEQIIEVPDDSYDLLNESAVTTGTMRLQSKSAAVIHHKLLL